MEYHFLLAGLRIALHTPAKIEISQPLQPFLTNMIQGQKEPETQHITFPEDPVEMEPEEMVVLRNTRLSQCRVFDFMTGEYTDIYNMDKLSSPDLYDVFLSGGQPLLTIENPAGKADRELVIFRDSYGSALAPLLLESYGKVTLVDIRYMDSWLLERYVEFGNQDVLFLYSTLVLNDSDSLT